MPEATATEETFDLSSDDDIHHYEYVCEQLTHILDKINPDSNTYKSRGQNVGWQNVNGTTTVTVENGEELIRKLCPDGYWSLTAIHLSKNELQLSLGHHDSPTGEIHTLTPEE